MERRDFLGGLAALAGTAVLMPRAQAQEKRGDGSPAVPAATWRAIESESRGRLGVAVLDTATGGLQGHRLDERFPMCSTFKWVLGAHVLHRVDQGLERLDRRIVYGPEALVPWSPVTERHVGTGMTVGQLCEATITLSDNAAANLLLATLGGPQGLTRYIRSQGDTVTRLDRTEPQLNEARPGDPRDTTSPRAMAQLLRTVVLGEGLSRSGRAQLVRWLQDCKTNGQRLGAHVPAGWALGSKTGSGARGATNDVGIYWPADRPPVVVAAYLAETQASDAARNAALARVAQQVTRAYTAGK